MKDINLTLAAMIFAFGLLGMYIHWRIAKRAKRVEGTFFDYLFADNPSGTGITLFAFASAMGGLFSIGSFDAVRLDAAWEALSNGYLYAPMAQAIALSVTTGYACDSVLNSGSGK
jgi:hypothetical protein